jgi:hypothetical protein
MSDKVIMTISLERNVNGTIQRKVAIEGEGFHYYELVGLLQICSYEFAEQSKKTASQMPKDKKTKIKFK